MVNLKKYSAFVQHFVLFLTFTALGACASKNLAVTKVEAKQLKVTENAGEISKIDNFVKPYREKLDRDLNTVLAYAPETLDKSKGEWQTTIGCLMADVTLAKSNIVFNKRQHQQIDICLLNHGGIRSMIPKGNVTTRTAFEIMPFENSAIVIALKGEQIREIADYIIKEKKPHPLAGATFTIDKDNSSKNIMVQGKALSNDAVYYVVTSDYLAEGGDNMTFFKKGVGRFDLDYKLRNILIDYFKEVDTIPVITDKRITKE